MNKIEKVTGDFNFVTDYNDDTVTVLNLLWNKQCEIIDILNSQLLEPKMLKLNSNDAEEIKRRLANRKLELYPSQQKTEEPFSENTFTKGELEFIDENLTPGDGTAYDSDVYHQLSTKINKLLRKKE